MLQSGEPSSFPNSIFDSRNVAKIPQMRVSARTSICSQDTQAGILSELREKVFRDKAARRHYLVTAPIPEKLRIMEEMRDTTNALRRVREENRAKVRAATATISK
jgi:hypothetical protein